MRTNQPQTYKIADANTFGLPTNLAAVKRNVAAGSKRFWANRGMREPGESTEFIFGRRAQWSH